MRAFFLGFLFFGFLSKSLAFLGIVITGASGRGTMDWRAIAGLSLIVAGVVLVNSFAPHK